LHSLPHLLLLQHWLHLLLWPKPLQQRLLLRTYASHLLQHHQLRPLPHLLLLQHWLHLLLHPMLLQQRMLGPPAAAAGQSASTSGPSCV
jgi:hypothetical protein